MDTYDRIEKLYEAQEKLQEALRLIMEATSGTDVQELVRGYTRPAIQQVTFNDGDYFGRNPGSVERLIAKLEQEA